MLLLTAKDILFALSGLLLLWIGIASSVALMRVGYRHLWLLVLGGTIAGLSLLGDVVCNYYLTNYTYCKNVTGLLTVVGNTLLLIHFIFISSQSKLEGITLRRLLFFRVRKC